MAGFGPGKMLSHNGKREKTDFKSLKKLFVFCKSYLPAIIIALILAVAGATTSILGPQKIGDLMNLIKNSLVLPNGIDFSPFLEIIIFLVCLYGIGAVANYTQQFIMATVTQKVSKKLRSKIDTKINKLPLSFFDKTTRGDILSVVTNDVDTISQTLGSTISNLVNAITLFVGVVVMMFTVNWILALVTIGTSLFGFVLIFLILSKSQKYFNQRQQNLGEMNGNVEETYSNHSIIKSYNAEEKTKENFEKINRQLFTNNWKSQSLAGIMQPIMAFAGNFSYAMIFIVGVSLILSGNSSVSFGDIISFTMYARLFSQPLTTLAQSFASIQQTSAASKRVFAMIDEKEVEDESYKIKTFENVEGNVEFKNVKFGYNESELVIKDFSATFKKGQKVAIVGPTGAGKTTLVNLLMRFYETDSGEILIDGINTKEVKREEVRELFDMILQDTWLFEGTIRENLVYNNKNISDERLDEVCSAVGIKHFIKTLKDGYDTKLDNSLGLSEGQKQQLTIARAMIKNSPMLILDEATSSVDTRTEIAIQNAMDKLTEGRTSFVIAHRLSTIKNADIILVLKDGDIVEQGTHETLLKQNGFYAELYNSQFADVG